MALPVAVQRAAAIAIGAGIAGVSAAVAVAASVARFSVTPSKRADAPVLVTEIASGDGRALVWLSGDDGLPGKFTLRFDEGAGWANLSEIVATREGECARELVSLQRGTLRPGVRGALTGWWYASPEELGGSCERITYETELGPAEAWLITPKRRRVTRWAVHVHGRGGLPEETLRGVVPLLRAGYGNLVIHYRNDPGAPTGVDGKYGNGVAESRDVDAAIATLRERGAKRITLVGCSMGGTACLLAATRGEHQSVIDGLVLDSPAIDWREILVHHANAMLVPPLVSQLGVWMLESGVVSSGVERGIPFEQLRAEAFAAALRVPTLVQASRGDTYVPSSGAERLAALCPELVELRLVDRAGHVRIWNVDPTTWELVTEEFVRRLPAPLQTR